MSQPRRYSCKVFAFDGQDHLFVYLAAKTDKDAIFVGSKLERDNPQCTGFEIRKGPRLVHRHARP